MSGIRGQGRGQCRAPRRRRNRIEIPARGLLGAPYSTPFSAVSSNRSPSPIQTARVAQLRCRPNRRRFAAWRSGACGARRQAQTAPEPRQGAGTGPADTRGSRRPGDGSRAAEALTRGASRCGGAWVVRGIGGAVCPSRPGPAPRRLAHFRRMCAGWFRASWSRRRVAAILALHRAVPRFADAAGGLRRRDRARAADAGHRHRSGQGRRPGALTARLPRLRRLIA
jgi:hypothetical protein